MQGYYKALARFVHLLARYRVPGDFSTQLRITQTIRHLKASAYQPLEAAKHSKRRLLGDVEQCQIVSRDSKPRFLWFCGRAALMNSKQEP